MGKKKDKKGQAVSGKPGSTILAKCSCKHEYQDNEHDGKRVKICNTKGTYVCTVCGRS